MKKQRKNFIVLTVLFSLIITLQAQTPLTQAVDFNVTDTDGEQHSLFSYLNSGYYVCIDFFMQLVVLVRQQLQKLVMLMNILDAIPET